MYHIYLLSLCTYVCKYVYTLYICLLLKVPPLLQLIYPEITNKSEIRANAAGSSENDIHIGIDGATCDEWPRSRAYQLQFLSQSRVGRTSGAPLPAHTQTHSHTNSYVNVGTHTDVAASGDQRRIGRAASAVFCLLSSSSSSRDNCLSGLDDLKT